MRMSRLYVPTLKEIPVEAEVVSHQLMLRAGLIRPLTAGVYTYLPLGYRVIRKIEEIVRQAMNEAGAQELLMPVIHTANLWKQTGRWETFGPLMIKFEDRKGREYCMGPTHEEVIADLIKDEIRSYKDLPLNLYQIQTKVRDEIRPRFGVMRGREFIMKDNYSLDRDFNGLDCSYQAMYDAYVTAFANCGLEVRVVEADSGAMGGKDSHEFMVVAEIGEDAIAFCDQCDYAANLERARASADQAIGTEEQEMEALQRVETPAQKTIVAVSNFLGIKAEQTIKSLALLADQEPILVLLCGNDELNQIKLLNYLGVLELQPVSEQDFGELYHSVAGFIGPVGLKDIRIIADSKVEKMVNAVSGANQKDQHFINVNPGRDFKVEQYLDLRNVQAGDRCPKCDGYLEIKQGIEVGHIFKLGTKYSESIGATYLDQSGQEKPVVMGSYGIGITRLVAAAIEQHHDQNGIVWPLPIAPYAVIILPLGKDEEVIKAGELIFQSLQEAGVEALLDDRSERPGVKFNEADLLGIPLRITIGSRSLKQGVIEAKIRRTGEELVLKVEQAVGQIIDLLNGWNYEG